VKFRFRIQTGAEGRSEDEKAGKHKLFLLIQLWVIRGEKELAMHRLSWIKPADKCSSSRGSLLIFKRSAIIKELLEKVTKTNHKTRAESSGGAFQD